MEKGRATFWVEKKETTYSIFAQKKHTVLTRIIAKITNRSTDIFLTAHDEKTLIINNVPIWQLVEISVEAAMDMPQD